MTALKAPKGSSGKQEFKEDRVANFYARAWMFYLNNKWVVYGGAVLLVALIVGLVGYFYIQTQRQVEAEERLAGIISYYERGDYETALEGTGERMGLREIADAFRRTDAGSMAAFYAADALFSIGEKDEAYEYFGRVPERSTLVGASAVAGRAAVYEDLGEYEQAGNYYRRAAGLYETPFTAPEYLMSAGRAYERAGLYQQAYESYNEIRERFPEAAEQKDIEMHLARVEARLDRGAQANS